MNAMEQQSVSREMLSLGEHRSVIRDIFEYGNQRKREIGAERVFDFSLGNPSTPPPMQVRQSLLRLLSEEDGVSLHGYTSSVGSLAARSAVAAAESRRAGQTLSPDCFYMTCGAAASLAIALKALLCPGEQVVLLAPFFPEYRVFAESAGAQVVVVPPSDRSMSPDLSALERALEGNVKAVLLNSPNNPSGAVLSEQTLSDIGELLRRASARKGSEIYLISDEPYREIVYDGVTVPYVPRFYANTLVCYSYSKSLSLPGERIGYIMVPPSVRNRQQVFVAVCGAGRALGYVCAPALFQRMLEECADLMPNTESYAQNRKLLYKSLCEMGYSCVRPDGAFYLFVQAPEGVCAVEFCEAAKQYELLLVPSDSFGVPGYARVSYCVSEQTVRGALPAFEALAAQYGLRGKRERQ